MLMTNFLKNRKSIRDFKKKRVDIDTLENVKMYLDTLEKLDSNGNVKFKIYENGEELFKNLEGAGGYSGVMIESPHYISLCLANDDSRTVINGAYYMEKLITKLNSLGLDTCWISIHGVSDEAKEKALGKVEGNVNFLLGVGYAKPRNPFVTAEVVSERMGVEDLVFDGEVGNKVDADELEARGLGDLFYYARFAPSAKNEQPWRFLIQDNKVYLLLPEGNNSALIDAGIMMYYFKELATSIGVSNDWKVITDENKIEAGYKFIAEITL